MTCCNYKKLPSLVCLLWLTVSARATADEQPRSIRAWSSERPHNLPDLDEHEKSNIMIRRPVPHAPIGSGGRIASIGRYDSHANMLSNILSNHFVEGSYDRYGMFDGGLDDESAASPIKPPQIREPEQSKSKEPEKPQRTLIEKVRKRNS
jgi:hypothetical protein